MTFGQPTPWTPAAREEFLRLFAEKLSFGDIAKKLAERGFENITRNACVGFARREGLKAHRAPGNHRPKKKQRRSSTPKPPRMIIRVTQVAQTPPPQHRERSGKLIDLDADQCRYPLGSFMARAPYQFCTNDKLVLPDGRRSSYCPQHHNLCHTPTLSPLRYHAS